MALSPYAPFTIVELRRWLKVSGSTNDDLLELVGNAATDELERLTGRLYVARTVTEVHDGDGGRRLALLYWPVRAVSSFTIDGASVPAADYQVDRTGTIWMVNGAVLTAGERNVSVTYSAGYALAEVPSEAKRVALDMAKVLWDEWGGGAVSASSLSLGPATYVVRPGWPYHVWTAVEALRREARGQSLLV